MHQTQALRCPPQLGSQRMSNSFQQQLREIARGSLGCKLRAPLKERLTDVADIKMQADIDSLTNNFIKDFISLQIKHM